MGGDCRKHGKRSEGEKQGREERQLRGHYLASFTTDDWKVVSWRSSGKQCKTHPLRVIPAKWQENVVSLSTRPHVSLVEGHSRLGMKGITSLALLTWLSTGRVDLCFQKRLSELQELAAGSWVDVHENDGAKRVHRGTSSIYDSWVFCHLQKKDLANTFSTQHHDWDVVKALENSSRHQYC